MATGNTTDNNVQAEGGKDEPPPPPPTPTVQALHGGNKVYKSGSLFLSSKGIGWTSWKKRWFILTQTSLVFYRSDPNVVPQKGGEANLTLGGIDLNSSGSVVVKDDKKLITVLLSDDRDGRSFTLKAETMEDLQEWKVALEEAISNAPNPAEVTGQNGVVKNDQSNAADVSSEQSKDKQIVNSMVIGGPILLALEDIDGTPSFLEKALRFLEEYGVKIEGILRQAADVDDVERRIQEYEKGKNEFLPEEDPHVIGDCIKYVLRELPSSPVPASCCKALLEAFRTERGMRVTAMRSAICETFPEPNRRLLQRILMMMQTVASHKAENRMSVPAVAACMAPLLLRPLLAGECEIENDFDVGGDGSVQLLQAAAAANHAQAIVIILLEEHDNIFGDGAATHEPYTDSEESGSESEEITDYEDEDEDEDGSFDDDGDDYTTEESVEVSDHESSPVSSEHGDTQHHKKGTESQSSGSESPKADDVAEANQNLSSNAPKTSSFQQESTQRTNDIPKPCSDDKKMQPNYSVELLRDDPAVKGMSLKPSELSYEASRSVRRSTVWGRTPGRKNLSMESLDILLENEAEIQKQECIKEDLETRASSKTNLLLQDTLERGNHELHERRLALEKDVAGLQEQLQKDMDLRAALEAGVDISQLPLYGSSLVDDKVKAELKEIAQVEADVINLKQKADDLESKLNQLREENSNIRHDSSGNQLQFNPSHQLTSKERQMDGGFPSASENLPRSKNETSSDKPGKDKDVKQDRPSSVNMPPLPQNQHTDATRNQKASGIPTSTVESGTKLASTSGKSSTKVAERRSQNATELPHSDKGSEIDNSQDSKGESVHQNPKGQSTHNPDKGGKSEGQPNLDRGKSESFSTADKNNTKTTPRTYSR